MVLFYLLYKSGRKFEVAHINYHLRGENANLDQNLVERIAKKYNVPCHCKEVNLGQQLEESGGNLQQEARKIRYAFFHSLLKHSDDKIVLAHHLDDQIEHFFLNLGRGANINGLAGMKEAEGNLFRPLLPFSRIEILEFAKRNKIEWREDESNTKNDYARNKLRNVYLPELFDRQPNLKQEVLILTKAFQTTQHELSQKIKPLLVKINQQNQLSFIDFDNLNHDELLELLRGLQLKGIFVKELHKLRNAENEKFLFVAKKQLKITKKKNHFLFSTNGTPS